MNAKFYYMIDGIMQPVVLVLSDFEIKRQHQNNPKFHINKGYCNSYESFGILHITKIEYTTKRKYVFFGKKLIQLKIEFNNT